MHDHCLNRNHGQRVYICMESDVAQRSKSTQIRLQLICHLFSPHSTHCPSSSVNMCHCLSLLQFQLLVTPPRLNKSLLPLFSWDVYPRPYQCLLEWEWLAFLACSTFKPAEGWDYYLLIFFLPAPSREFNTSWTEKTKQKNNVENSFL